MFKVTYKTTNIDMEDRSNFQNVFQLKHSFIKKTANKLIKKAREWSKRASLGGKWAYFIVTVSEINANRQFYHAGPPAT